VTPLRPDPDALLVALVLAPTTYSRNRFFELYRDDEARRVRRRASVLRSILRHLAETRADRRGRIVALEPLADGRSRLTYEVPSLGLRRTSILEPIEASLLRLAATRSNGENSEIAADEADRRRVDEAAQRLMHREPVAFAGDELPG
jgi:hypothetical protein